MDGFKRPAPRPMPPQPVPTQEQPPRHTAPIVQQPQAAPTASGTYTALRDDRPNQPEPTAQAGSQNTLPPTEQPRLAAKNPRKRRWVLWASLALLLVLIASTVGARLWYDAQLQPVSTTDKAAQDVEIKDDTTFSYLAGRLEERGLIRSSLAFELFAQQQGRRGQLKAGTCRLNPSQSPKEILDTVTSGCNEFKKVTFYPGGTIEQPIFKPVGSTVVHDKYVKKKLRDAGFTEAEITAALSKQYTGPLFAGKPANTTLEGYIFGETYHVAPSATAEDVLKVAFDQMYKVVKAEDLEAKYKAQGLSLYQGITLASIVQKELNCEDKPTEARKATCYSYQQRIASVFYNRLKIDMPLGSDSTFIYAADMLGQPASSRIDSPYNTYKHVGLPPGPIASPGQLALRASANPATTDALYFVAGDDGLIYFSRTQAEHEANTAKYCHKFCAY